jgi:filamentous hemagglutinin
VVCPRFLTGIRSGKFVVDAILEVVAKREAAKVAAAETELLRIKLAGLADSEAGNAGRFLKFEPGRFSDDIEQALKSSSPGELLEGQVGKALYDKGVLVDYQSIFRHKFVEGKPLGLGEIDAETPNFIIEVASGTKPGKQQQLLKFINNPTLNPDRKQVILFAPNMDKAQQIKSYEKLGVKVISTLDQLFLYGASRGGL